MTEHERAAVRRVLGDQAYRLVAQEPGPGHHAGKAASLEGLTVQELSDVLRAGVVGIAMALGDVRHLADRVAQAGQSLMAKIALPADDPDPTTNPRPAPLQSAKIEPGVLIRFRHSKGDTPAQIADRLNATETHGEHNRKWTAQLVHERTCYLPETVAHRRQDIRQRDIAREMASELVTRLRGEGKTAAQIAQALNREGIPRHRGQAWDAASASDKMQTLGLYKQRIASRPNDRTEP